MGPEVSYIVWHLHTGRGSGRSHSARSTLLPSHHRHIRLALRLDCVLPSLPASHFWLLVWAHLVGSAVLLCPSVQLETHPEAQFPSHQKSTFSLHPPQGNSGPRGSPLPPPNSPQHVSYHAQTLFSLPLNTASVCCCVCVCVVRSWVGGNDLCKPACPPLAHSAFCPFMNSSQLLWVALLS